MNVQAWISRIDRRKMSVFVSIRLQGQQARGVEIIEGSVGGDVNRLLRAPEKLRGR